MQDKYTDLHIHSIYSEGSYTPKEIVTKAKSLGFGALALTDHNTIDGVDEFLKHAKAQNIKAVSGIEIYTTWKNKIFHILGYNFDHENTWLRSSVDELCADRTRAIDNALYVLKKKGFKIDEKKLYRTKSKYIGFGQIIGWLQSVEQNDKKIKRELKTNDPDFFDIINHYFKKGKKPLLDETALPLKTVLNMITHAGGIPILAHPGAQLEWKDDKYIIAMKKMGLKGIEVITPHHNWHQIEHYQNLAKKLRLKITGGTDFHSPQKQMGKNSIQTQWQYLKPPYSIFNELMKR